MTTRTEILESLPDFIKTPTEFMGKKAAERGYGLPAEEARLTFMTMLNAGIDECLEALEATNRPEPEEDTGVGGQAE